MDGGAGARNVAGADAKEKPPFSEADAGGPFAAVNVSTESEAAVAAGVEVPAGCSSVAVTEFVRSVFTLTAWLAASEVTAVLDPCASVWLAVEAVAVGADVAPVDVVGCAGEAGVGCDAGAAGDIPSNKLPTPEAVAVG